MNGLKNEEQSFNLYKDAVNLEKGAFKILYPEQ